MVNCPVCHRSTDRDTWTLRPVPCSEKCKLEMTVRKLVPRLYRESDPEKIKSRESYSKALSWEYGPKGLYLVGKSRTGKSRALYGVVMRCIRAGMKVDGFRPGEFVQRMMDCMALEYNPGGLVERLGKKDLVFIDDFGKDTLTEAQQLAYFNMLERRIGAGKPTLFASNVRSRELKDRTPEGFVERIVEFCEVIDFDK